MIVQFNEFLPTWAGIIIILISAIVLASVVKNIYSINKYLKK